MTPEETYILIDRLDESLTGTANTDLDRVFEANPEASREWHCLNLAVDAVNETGLYEQVSAVKTAWRTEQAVTGVRVVTARQTRESSGGIVRTMFKKYGLRAAACILIVASSATLYKYLSISSQTLYERYYSSYELNTSRGADAAQPIVKAYDAKDWTGVLSLARTAKNKDNQSEFLAGMADLALKQYDDAITHFEEIIAVNTHAGSDYYQDEAEYYLAISWLARNKVNEAMPILEKIRADVHHQYHEKVAKMSFFDLRLAQFKENK